MTGADRSESRKVGKKGGGRAQWGEENRIVPWKQGFLCVPPDGIKLILSLLRGGEREEDINLAFT